MDLDLDIACFFSGADIYIPTFYAQESLIKFGHHWAQGTRSWLMDVWVWQILCVWERLNLNLFKGVGRGDIFFFGFLFFLYWNLYSTCPCASSYENHNSQEMKMSVLQWVVCGTGGLELWKGKRRRLFSFRCLFPLIEIYFELVRLLWKIENLNSQEMKTSVVQWSVLK